MPHLVTGECVVDERDHAVGEIEHIRDGVWQARLYGPNWPAFTEHHTREAALDAISQAYFESLTAADNPARGGKTVDPEER